MQWWERVGLGCKVEGTTEIGGRNQIGAMWQGPLMPDSEVWIQSSEQRAKE